MMNQSVNNKSLVSQGVDELISRLRQEGVDAGNTEAKSVVERANKEAKKIIDKANMQAKQLKDEAKKEADALLNGGKEALKIAMRDAVLSMKSGLTEGFTTDVRRLIERELQQPDMLKTLILEVAGTALADTKISDQDRIELILPKHAVGLEELQNAPEKIENSPLTELVYGLTRDMLKKGVSFSVSDELSNGIQVKLQDQDVTLDFTEQAIGTILLKHLQPRFRAILEGVLR